MLVTKNLATALTYLRNESYARNLWVDAICINQNDLDERSTQVAQMGAIYRTARRVISWLGIRDPFFDPFIEMEYATSLFPHIKFLKEYPPFKTYLESEDSQRPYPDFENHKRAFNNGLYSLQLLIGEREREKPVYWQRAWIIQEVSSAQTLILQSGLFTISEEDIDLVADFISSPKVAMLLMEGRLYRQLSQAYVDMAKYLQPKPLSPELYRRTCSLGLLQGDKDGSLQSFMDGLDLKVGLDGTREPIKFSEGRFRLKLMASSINGQCMFAVKQHTLKDSMEFEEVRL
ncbi:hypothetical protein PG984_012129 [Apiospora sp. TS-2023a]